MNAYRVPAFSFSAFSARRGVRCNPPDALAVASDQARCRGFGSLASRRQAAEAAPQQLLGLANEVVVTQRPSCALVALQFLIRQLTSVRVEKLAPVDDSRGQWPRVDEAIATSG